jgi:hypothetical protein
VADFYNPNYYAVIPQANPTGPASGDGRVYRGGSWASRVAYELFGLTATGRKWNYPNLSRDNLGFRCAVSALPQSSNASPDVTVEPIFGKVSFCASPHCTEGEQVIFPEGIKEVFFMFNYDHLRLGVEYSRRWYVNGTLYLDYTCQWQPDWPSSGLFLKKVYDIKNGLAPGEWKVEIFLNGQLQDSRSFQVEGTPREEKFFDSACPDKSPTLP